MLLFFRILGLVAKWFTIPYEITPSKITDLTEFGHHNEEFVNAAWSLLFVAGFFFIHAYALAAIIALSWQNMVLTLFMQIALSVVVLMVGLIWVASDDAPRNYGELGG